MKKILHTIPFLSSTIQSTYSKSYTLIYDQFNEAIKVPQKWVEDIKHLEFNELLASSIGPLVLFFNWKKYFNKDYLLYISLSGILISLLIIVSNVYRPDAGL